MDLKELEGSLKILLCLVLLLLSFLLKERGMLDFTVACSAIAFFLSLILYA